MNRTLLILALTAVGFAAPLTAATVVVTTTLDLAQSGLKSTGFTYTQGVPPFTAVDPFTLSAGDMLDYTISFKAGQSLTLTNPSLLWAYIYADQISDVVGTGSLALLDASGNAFLTSDLKTDSEGMVHFGQQFGPADFVGGLPSSLTFYGLHYVGTLDSYVDPTVTTRTYQTPAFALSADGLSGAGNVPEPGIWALLVAGFGLVGIVARRRTALAA